MQALLPDDKLARIQTLRAEGAHFAVGDGDSNEAPALAAAIITALVPVLQ